MDIKTASLIPSQLPAFITEDPEYKNFVLFIQAYYEWMEQNGNVIDVSKNIPNYSDIDNTTNQFVEYFYNDFLPYFPKEILADKQKVTKIARELYQSKGTPASFKFLFRVLYDSDVDFFYTRDAVLRASAGKWYVAKILNLSSTDLNFLKVSNLKIFGETTKSIATIENSIFAGTKIQLFIEGIEREFVSGEFVRVIDTNNQDVLFNGQPLRAKVVGQVSSVLIDTSNRGNFYQPNDPVVLYGGLSSNTGHGATAVVGTTTAGSIERIAVDLGGYGYTLLSSNTKTTIAITNDGGATAHVGSYNPDPRYTANVSLITLNYIGKKASIKLNASDYLFKNTLTTNANTSLANAFSFASFATYPISSVLVDSVGSGISTTPIISAQSLYGTEDNYSYVDLKTVGMLAPIQIISGGRGYVANDRINVIGGSGYGAYANVSTVNSNGSITSVSYVYENSNLPRKYPLGGMGYLASGIPKLNIVSANTQASNASLVIPGILGDGAAFSTITNKIGTIQSINVIDAGEDYISTPTVSLKVQDIVVSNVYIDNLPQRGDLIYQGSSYSNSTYSATVSEITQLYPFSNTQQSLYNVRVFNYNALPNYTLPLKINSKSIVLNMSNQYPTLNTQATRYDSTGVITYGDGSAKANATFMNGLVSSQGQYLDTSGQPSSFDVLQSVDYNDYTYQLTLEREIEKYRTTLMNLLHPTGMKVLGRYVMKSNSYMKSTAIDVLNEAHTLPFYTGTAGSNVMMYGTFSDPSSNTVYFNNLAGANLNGFISNTNTLSFTTANNEKITSRVKTVDYSNNKITIADNVWLSFANIATCTANASSNIINITSITNSYNIINNGIYSNTAYPLKDIIRAGDVILVANNTQKTVLSVDYTNNRLTLTSNLANTVNSYISVSRTLTGLDGNVLIYGPTGIQYFPEITTESGISITTEDGRIILLG